MSGSCKLFQYAVILVVHALMRTSADVDYKVIPALTCRGRRVRRWKVILNPQEISIVAGKPILANWDWKAVCEDPSSRNLKYYRAKEMCCGWRIYDTVLKMLLIATLTKRRLLHEGILGSDLDAARCCSWSVLFKESTEALTRNSFGARRFWNWLRQFAPNSSKASYAN
jgi:hypothetical protein